MLDIRFLYPEGGYIYYTHEAAKLLLEVMNSGDHDETVQIGVSVKDYKDIHISDSLQTVKVAGNDTMQVEFCLELKALGYYQATVVAQTQQENVTKVTGVGVTTPHERSPWKESVFGVSANQWVPEQHIPLFAKLGVRYLRNPGKAALIQNKHLMEKYGMQSTVQIQGKNILTDERYAPPERNSAYYYQQQLGDVASIQEHGNEHWEERNLALLAEWHKTSGYARLTADPAGWYTNSGAAGVDIHKFNVLYDQGMFDYITCLSVHAYSFPLAPEQPHSYWSVKRLEDLAQWMKDRNLEIPVACMEQGYPAMYGQTRCESYSPGDLCTLDGQIDYLVRSWLQFISLGVSKVVWYNGPWSDGFSFLEKDGPAPWPAAMALAELIRAVDNADYVGDYQKDEGVYIKVFRKKADASLFGVIWKPVYFSRSCELEKNYTLDGSCTELDGTAQELFDYALHHVKNEVVVKDIMGNPITVDNDTIQIGDRPLYVYGLTEDILSELTDITVFPVKQVVAKPLPSNVILGLSDAWPFKKGEFLTSQFMPGETRQYKVRVHNYSDSVLHDRVILTAPDAFELEKKELDVTVSAGLTMEYAVNIRCRQVAEMGVYHIHARLNGSDAHPVYQIAAINCPIRLKPVDQALKNGDTVTLRLANHAKGANQYRVDMSHKDITLASNIVYVTIDGGAVMEIPFEVQQVNSSFEPVFDVKVESEGLHAAYQIVLPLHYIEHSASVHPDTLANKQQMVLTGYNLLMTPGDDYDGPSLLGNAEPAPMLATARMELDNQYLYAHFNIFDDTLCCVKNCRRNNIDSDGIWIRLYENMEAQKPFRHFCIMPADQAGNPEGCSVKEVSAGVLFLHPFTDYDFSGITVKSAIYGDRYTIDVKIDRASIGMETLTDGIVADIRVLDMNHDDWTRLYDTGKVLYKVR